MMANDQQGFKPLVMPTDEQAQAMREILDMHIDKLNQDFARAVEGMHADTAQFKTFQKRSTYLLWAMFWGSGFLARGIFNGPTEWNLASFIFGFATGACVYFAVHAFMLGRMK